MEEVLAWAVSNQWALACFAFTLMFVDLVSSRRTPSPLRRWLVTPLVWLGYLGFLGVFGYTLLFESGRLIPEQQLTEGLLVLGAVVAFLYFAVRWLNWTGRRGARRKDAKTRRNIR